MSFKSFFLAALACGLVIFLSSCDLDDLLPNQSRTADGFWEYGAGNNYPGSFRNFHYEFDLQSDNDTLSVTLSSNDTDVSLWLINPLGELIRQRWGQRTVNIFRDNLNSGTYRVIVGTNERGEMGNFQLSVGGNISSLNLVSSSTLEQNAAWLNSGGGNNYPYSPRNHLYTVEVTDNNSMLDIVQTSDDTDVSLWLFNPLGEQVQQSWGGRSRFLVKEANAGTYTIVAGTNTRDVLDADYSLNVNGQIANLTRIICQDTTVNGTISNGGGNNNSDSAANDVYLFEVTENNTALDIIMESPDFDISMWLIDPLGVNVQQRWGARSRFMVEGVSAGTYKIICGTNSSGNSGQYSMSVVGKYTNFRKQ